MLKNDINIPLLATIGAVSSCLLLTVLVGVHAWYLYEVNGTTQGRWSGVTYQRVYELKNAQRLELNSPPKWANREQGVVQIPITQAMDVIAQTGGKLPTTSPAR